MPKVFNISLFSLRIKCAIFVSLMLLAIFFINIYSSKTENLPPKDYDYLVYIGRFQPFHKGHELTVKEALNLSNKVIILCGSSNLPRSFKNPFSYDERVEMIKASFKEKDNGDDRLWVENVNSVVKQITGDNKKLKIGLIGHFKDSSSYYLGLFPNWPLIEINNFQNINATNIREGIFIKNEPVGDFNDHLSESVILYLDKLLKNSFPQINDD